MVIKLISLNVNGIANQTKRRAIFKYVRDRADIAFLQETHSVKSLEKVWKAEWGGDIIFAHGESNARGTCILATKNARAKFVDIQLCQDGRFIVADMVLLNSNQTITICNVYAPNKDSPTYFQNVFDIVMQRGNNCIVMGDFNIALDSEKDRLNTNPNNPKATKKLLEIISVHDFTEVWRSRNPDKLEFSWSKINASGEGKYSRIDYAVISAGIDTIVENATYVPATMTDHCAYFIAIQDSINKRGTGYWKLNVTLLQEPLLTELKKNVQDLLLNHESTDICLLWEKIKTSSADICKNAARHKSSEKKVIISQLQEKINTLQMSMPLNRLQSLDLRNSQLDLDTLLHEQAEALIFRSRSQWQGGRRGEMFKIFLQP